MKYRYVLRPSVLFVGMCLLLTACGVTNTPSISNEATSKDELISLLWRLPESNVRELNTALDAELLKRPNMTEEEKNTLAFSLLKRQAGSIPEVGLLEPQQGYPWGVLTPAENRLCRSNAYNCARTKGFSDTAKNTAPNWFREGAYLGKQDAFRHGYWNALMRFHLGHTWAYNFATAHESETPPGSDRTMDLRNNIEGREVGRIVRYSQNLASNVNHYIVKGDFWIVNGGPNGRLVPSDQPWRR